MEEVASIKSVANPISVVQQAFGWMFGGLLLTTIVSFWASSSNQIQLLLGNSPLVFFGLIIVELALVIFLSARITKITHETAILSFLAYSILNGITFSVIFLAYTSSSLALAFLDAALVFGSMALFGYTTKHDLTTVGSLAMMGLIGVIIASLVNLFLKSNMTQIIVSYITIAVFMGLTAFDSQKIKAMASIPNAGILGALSLYLDFINLFLSILRIIGKRR